VLDDEGRKQEAIRNPWTLTSNGKVMSSHKAELNL